MTDWITDPIGRMGHASIALFILLASGSHDGFGEKSILHYIGGAPFPNKRENRIVQISGLRSHQSRSVG